MDGLGTDPNGNDDAGGGRAIEWDLQLLADMINLYVCVKQEDPSRFMSGNVAAPI